MMKVLVLLVPLAACGIPIESTETGPNVEIDLDTDAQRVRSVDGVGADLRLASATEYTITMTAIVLTAVKRTKSDFENIATTSVPYTIAVEGEAIPDSPLVTDDSYFISFTRKDVIALPATAMGKSIVIHSQCTDADGVTSNVVDWSVLLD